MPPWQGERDTADRMDGVAENTKCLISNYDPGNLKAFSRCGKVPPWQGERDTADRMDGVAENTKCLMSNYDPGNLAAAWQIFRCFAAVLDEPTGAL